jgi:hypothetical protein
MLRMLRNGRHDVTHAKAEPPDLPAILALPELPAPPGNTAETAYLTRRRDQLG